jgi:hypothetical protein
MEYDALLQAFQALQAQVNHLQAQQQAAAPQQAAPPASAPKPPKPDFFHGDRDISRVRQWCFAVDTYFYAVSMSQASRVPFAVTLLRGHALTWWQSLAPEQRPADWASFQQLLIAYHQPISAVTSARDALARLMQRTSVAAYVKEFKDLALNIPDFSEAERLDRFKRGLKSNVRLHVALANPTTFEQAVTISGQVDDILFGQRSNNPRPDNFRQRPFARAPENQATPMELGTMTQPKEREQFNNPTPERKYEIKNGLCFYCKEPGHMALHCPKKRPSGNYQDRR